jgi:hypothetical protein
VIDLLGIVVRAQLYQVVMSSDMWVCMYFEGADKSDDASIKMILLGI